MKINQMEYFAQVCRLGTITRAAKELHVSQPSVTAAIHEMEKELGVSLFYRRNNKLYLTEEGNFVLDRVVDILKDVERLDRDLKGFVGTKNLIRLGVPLQIGACLLPLLFGKFRKMNPEVKLEIQESGAMDIVRSLLEDSWTWPSYPWIYPGSGMCRGRRCTSRNSVSAWRRGIRNRVWIL